MIVDLSKTQEFLDKIIILRGNKAERLLTQLSTLNQACPAQLYTTQAQSGVYPRRYKGGNNRHPLLASCRNFGLHD